MLRGLRGDPCPGLAAGFVRWPFPPGHVCQVRQLPIVHKTACCPELLQALSLGMSRRVCDLRPADPGWPPVSGSKRRQESLSHVGLGAVRASRVHPENRPEL